MAIQVVFPYESLSDEQSEALVRRVAERLGEQDRFDVDLHDGGQEYSASVTVGGEYLHGVLCQGTPMPEGPIAYCIPALPHLRLRFKDRDQFKFPVLKGTDTSGAFLERVEAAGRTDALETRLDDCVAVVTAVYRALDPGPAVVYGLTDGDVTTIVEIDGYGLPVTEDSVADNRLEHVPWLAILPPAFVETYGRERLLSTPAWRTEALDDGSVLVVTHADVIQDFDRPLDAVHDHLGIENPVPDPV